MDARSDRLLGRLALGVTLILILVFAATVGRLAGRRMLESLGWIAPSTATYAAGDMIDLSPETYRLTPFTLVLFARSNCAACEAAAPFYQSLARVVSGQPHARMVLSSPVAAGRNDAEIAYARGLGLDSSAVLPWTASKPRVRSVPTLVIVNDRGIVLASWEGAPRAADRARVLETVRATIAR